MILSLILLLSFFFNASSLFHNSIVNNILDSSIDKSNIANDSQLKRCLGNDHVQGKWVYQENLSRKSFYCCGLDDLPVEGLGEDESLCNSHENTKYHLSHFEFFQGSDTFLAHVGGRGCYCDARQSTGREAISEREKYVWVPETCELQSWNAQVFCEALNNRTILMVGDSTSQQVISSLTSMIRTGNGGCAHNIYFGKSFFLMFKQYAYKRMVDYMKENIIPDILIYNAGVHLGDEGDLISVLENLKAQLISEINPILQEQNRKIQYVWKSISPGHFSCDQSTKPYSSYSEYHLIDEGLDKYRWNMHNKFDEIAKNYSGIMNYTYLDVSPLYLRPDAHPGGKDCLHFCVPGPLDLFAVLLMNKLVNKEI